MVIAYHVIFGTYGFWLPNDPRGSWSDFVAAWELVRFGKATTVTTRRSLAYREHDFQARLSAKEALQYPHVTLNGLQARAVARGFAEFAAKSGVVMRACSILPEHVQLVILRHTYKIESIVNLLNGAATRSLIAEEIHPLAAHRTAKGSYPKAFARGQWKCFIDNQAYLRSAIRYVEENPIKEGMRRQVWRCVAPLDS
jgi:REP element-mobilizing transposase RayT